MTPVGGPEARGYAPRDIALDTELGSRAYLHMLMAEQRLAQFRHAIFRWRIASRRRR